MPRKILLLEPNYKNKYPPMGLMKLATYFRTRGDDVRFFKGNLKDLAVELLFEEYWTNNKDDSLGKYTQELRQYIKDGKNLHLEKIPETKIADDIYEIRKRYKSNDYPKFDIICITTLFTFFWKETINTIKESKKFKSDNGTIIIGGIASTILYAEIEKETGIKPYINERGGALLDKPGQIDDDSNQIIDELPLDYSILDEIDYKYPAKDAYFAYATRGCVNHCTFCAVPRLEPVFCNYKSIKEQIKQSADRFGEKKDLLLLDNNVFASKFFNVIIDEIKELGFGKGELYHYPNEYKIAINNIRDNYNTRTYIKKIVAIYDQVSELLNGYEQGKFYIDRENKGLLYADTATSEEILDFDINFAPIYDKLVYSKINTSRGRIRYVDFNQGLDARLVTDEKMKKLAEINIFPLRIAFDRWGVDPQRPELGPMQYVYRNAIEKAAKYGIRDLSNYLLFNTDDDTPEDLYNRIRYNVELCDELNLRIYSFPMKFHPIDDPVYFKNRNFVGKYWTRKYIRAIQAILNSTHGKIGQGKNFFEAAFGENIENFNEILIMPETFIIERYKYDNEAYVKYLNQGGRENPEFTKSMIEEYGNLTSQWRIAYKNLSHEQKKAVLSIIENNIFTQEVINKSDPSIQEVLKFYYIKRKKSNIG